MTFTIKITTQSRLRLIHLLSNVITHVCAASHDVELEGRHCLKHDDENHATFYMTPQEDE